MMQSSQELLVETILEVLAMCLIIGEVYQEAIQEIIHMRKIQHTKSLL